MQRISAFIYQDCRNNKLLIIPTAQNLLHMGRIIFLSETFLLWTGQIRWSPPENASWDMHIYLWKPFIVLKLSDCSFVAPHFFSQQFISFWIDVQILLLKLKNAGLLSKCEARWYNGLQDKGINPCIFGLVCICSGLWKHWTEASVK